LSPTTLTAGTRLGPYEIVALLGVGGMGEVYRATDTNLRRQVAIKVLPASVAADADRLARFHREAEVLAALNHPNIAHVFGLERQQVQGRHDGTFALVMELVEGPTLADRIARGPIPLAEALPIAKQISEAIEAAHDQNIIHRDLKPANIKVRPDGTVKVLDFGLAKAIEGPEGGSDRATLSPTITSPAMTRAGMILGTAAYMAPEQARGLTIDKRVDLWAFGCILYEMLTGHRAFEPSTGSGVPRAASNKEGDPVVETLAAVLRAEPDWNALPATTPASIRRLLQRCLAKDPKQRLREAGSATLEIDNAQAGDTEASSGSPTPRRPVWQRAAAVLGVVVLTMAATGALAWRLLRQPVAPAQVVRFSIPLEKDSNYSFGGRHVLTISPDGRRLAYVADGRIYLRALNEASATPIRGTEIGGGRSPFFSPDGEWLGFWSANALKKVALSGGAPVTLCAAGNLWGAVWSADDTILVGQGAAGIWQVPAGGGAPVTLIKMKEGELAQSPQRLPVGDWILYTLRPSGVGDWNQAQIVAQSVTTGERRVLINAGRDARYVPTGHLVYALNGAIYAARFDATRVQVIGGPVSLVEGVADANNATGAAQFSVAANGTLAYIGGSLLGLAIPYATLVWVDRAGREEPLKFDAQIYWYPRISPDGTSIAVSTASGANPVVNRADIWVLDSLRGSKTKITFEANNRFYPVWSADGTRLIFSDGAATKNRIRWAPATGAGSIETLLEGEERYPTSVSRDGRLLAFYQNDPKTQRDLWILPLGGKEKPQPFLSTPFEDSAPMFSPDGRWVAYASNKSGQNEIYVRPYPAAGAQEYTISAGGGTEPLWAPSGRELFYRHGNELMSVAVSVSAGALLAAPPVRLFSGEFLLDSSTTRTVANYDISHDGKRFLMLKTAALTAAAPPPPISVALNWTEELKRRAPTH
jgi:serine/threonine-protein kinase